MKHGATDFRNFVVDKRRAERFLERTSKRFHQWALPECHSSDRTW